MQRSTDRHLWWDSIANYEVVRNIHEADGVLLCISGVAGTAAPRVKHIFLREKD